MSDSSIEKLALMVAEMMQEINRLRTEQVMLRQAVLECKDICRGCAGFQQDEFK